MNSKKLTLTTVTAAMLLSFQAWAAKLNIAMPDFKQNTTLINEGPQHPNVIDALSNEITKSDWIIYECTEVLLNGDDDPIDELLPYAQNKTTLESENDGTITYYTMPEATWTNLDSLHVSLTKVLIGSDGEWIIEARLLVKTADGKVVGIIHRDHVNPNGLNSDDVNPKKEQGSTRTNLRLSWWETRAKKILGK